MILSTHLPSHTCLNSVLSVMTAGSPFQQTLGEELLYQHTLGGGKREEGGGGGGTGIPLDYYGGIPLFPHIPLVSGQIK